jgi:hypothetical protein
MKLAVLSCLALSACVPYTTSTTITLRDPRAVALRAGCCDEPVLPAGATAAEVPLAEGRVETAPGVATDVQLSAQRTAAGAILLEWHTHMALPHGELQAIVPAQPSWTVSGGIEDAVPRGEVARMRFCAELSPLSARGTRVGYTPTATLLPASSTMECSWTPGRAALPYLLETGWDNLVEIRTRKTPTLRWLAWFELPYAAAALGGGIYLAARPGGSTQSRVLGGLLASLGLAITIPLAPSAFARTRETVVSRSQ